MTVNLSEIRFVPEWEMFECANCGDCHCPDDECYCGCKRWEKGQLVKDWRLRPEQ